MKYVVLNILGEEQIFIFPTMVTHKDMVETIRFMKVEDTRGRWRREYTELEVVSAGFVTQNGTCYGNSESLNVKSRNDIDTELLESQY